MKPDSKMMRIVAPLAALLLTGGHAAGALCEEPGGPRPQAGGIHTLSLSLEGAAKIAVERSHRLAARREAAGAAREAAQSADTKRYPQLGLSAQSQVMSKIGEIIPTAGPPVQIGDHYNWSVGPVLSWTAWDAGAISKGAKSLSRTADSERFAAEAVKRDALLEGRMAYFSVQLALEQLSLVADSLNVARMQHADVARRAKAGSASRLDLVTAHQEVMDRERDAAKAQAELAAQVRQLVSVLDMPQARNPTAPAGRDMAARLTAPLSKPDLLLDLDPIAKSLKAMRPLAAGEASVEKHPAAQAAKEKKEAALMAWKAAKAGHWPKVTVQGSSTFQYPNFAQLETVQQNQLTFGLSVPILDWGMISKEARSKKHMAASAASELLETRAQLSRNLGEARDRAALLEKQRVSAAAAARDATEAASLVYDAYLAGEVIFLEVQRANLRALATRVEAARTDSQLLVQLARLENLITEPQAEIER